jgi:hypothetical protein
VYGDGRRRVPSVDFVYSCLKIFYKVGNACRWSSVDVNDGMISFGFFRCIVYFQNDGSCVWDGDVIDGGCV